MFRTRTRTTGSSTSRTSGTRSTRVGALALVALAIGAVGMSASSASAASAASAQAAGVAAPGQAPDRADRTRTLTVQQLDRLGFAVGPRLQDDTWGVTARLDRIAAGRFDPVTMRGTVRDADPGQVLSLQRWVPVDAHSGRFVDTGITTVVNRDHSFRLTMRLGVPGHHGYRLGWYAGHAAFGGVSFQLNTTLPQPTSAQWADLGYPVGPRLQGNVTGVTARMDRTSMPAFDELQVTGRWDQADAPLRLYRMSLDSNGNLKQKKVAATFVWQSGTTFRMYLQSVQQGTAGYEIRSADCDPADASATEACTTIPFQFRIDPPRADAP
ncbi:MAG: hypothetical protein R2737_07360 [Candidatus Nanopelagicales bacterium]